MKIAINIKSALGDKTGKGVYAYNIIRELVKNSRHEFVLYAPYVKDPFFKELKRKNVRIVKIPGGGMTWHKNVYKDVKERYAKGLLDAYFAPSSFIVPALLSIWAKKIPYYMTVHDLVAFLYSKTHNKKAVIIEKLTLGRALARANGVFAVSENTKKDIAVKFSTPPHKITITHNAVSDHFLKFKRDAKALTQFRKKYRLPKKYILSLGTLVPRKNLGLTLSAFEKLTRDPKFPDDIDLVIVGGSGWGKVNDLAVRKAQKNPRIHLLGYIPYDELPSVYAAAQVFVYPSLYEGFGIPPLEGMACGCPVIVSNTSSLPEVVGDSALKVSPHSSEGLAKAIKKLTGTTKTSKALHQKLIKSGRENIKRFSWKESSKKILQTMQS